MGPRKGRASRVDDRVQFGRHGRPCLLHGLPVATAQIPETSIDIVNITTDAVSAWIWALE